VSISTELGLIGQGLGDNTRNKFRLRTGLTKGWQVDLHAFHKVELKYTQFLNDANNKHDLSARYRYFRWITQRHLLNLRLTAEQINGYSPLHNKLIGGDQGLRAYKSKFQQGERRVVGLFEYRHITNWSPYSLLNTAYSLYIESGGAWTDSDNAEPLANIGFGILLSPTRSSRAAINRFEVVVPLVHGEDVGKFQFFVGTKINY